MDFIRSFKDISLQDLPLVGGKNASLGQLIQDLTHLDVRVPDGFAVTTQAYWHFLQYNGLTQFFKEQLALIDYHDITSLTEVSARLRSRILEAPFPPDLEDALKQAYLRLSAHYGEAATDVAVRSSATAEDLPDASFAGQQDTYLAIRGADAVVDAAKKCIASLFNSRALAYRSELKIDFEDLALSVGVQKMVRSDLATAGVAFSLEPETGFNGVVTIAAAYGLGELVVQGSIVPDEFYVHKELLKKGFRPIIQKKLGTKKERLAYDENVPGRTKKIMVTNDQANAFCLSDDMILAIARVVTTIEEQYAKLKNNGAAVDVEWAVDGQDGLLYIVQARPETVHNTKSFKRLTYTLMGGDQKMLVRGLSVGQKVVSGRAHVLNRFDEGHDFQQGDILIAEMTDPDWVPLMKKASALITDHGGRTCHAAIVARELGIPALVATHSATKIVKTGMHITLDCSQGTDGYVYEGEIPFTVTEHDIRPARVQADVMINCGEPSRAFEYAQLPVAGVGLARLEFIITTMIKAHPMALCQPERLDESVRALLDTYAHGYSSYQDYYVNVVAQGVGTIAGAFYPRPVIVRLTDFKTNEYRDLVGGEFFESFEENPMIGFRGASRYKSPSYAPAFELECRALVYARKTMGFDNICIMVPFVRTVHEAESVVTMLAHNGLKRGENGLQLYMMVEIPSNALLIEEFGHFFDGFSIGSNDLTQLTLGIDRDSGVLADSFDERDPAVRRLIAMAIEGARVQKKPIGICGQAPSDFPEFAKDLVKSGISSLSVNPDALPRFLKYFEEES